ncbi:MAG: alpha/beta fold hydrolase [Planctomycetes bacterium]|nr:alpha/beta fold hydrolase [Planctomycetota bacterium]
MLSFRPLPLLGNPHVQTILGNFLSGDHRIPRITQRIVPLADGDRISLLETQPRPSSSQAPIALLVHGLGGSHRSGYMVRLTNRLSERGWRVFRMDLRGAGDGFKLARRFYNAACSDDVATVVDGLVKEFPLSPLVVAGFSLGGNIVLKYAGELGEHAPRNLRAIAALAPPIDLVRCSQLIARLPLYDGYYVRNLTSQVARHQRHFSGLPRIVFPRRTTLRQFDDLYTAPRWGYADALDYYQKASALPWLVRIGVPTFVLTARDDPFVAVESFEPIRGTSMVEIHITDHGGHLGYLGADGLGGIRWAESQLLHWLDGQISFARPNNSGIIKTSQLSH